MLEEGDAKAARPLLERARATYRAQLGAAHANAENAATWLLKCREVEEAAAARELGHSQ